MPCVSIPAIVCAVSSRMPVCPVASVESRSSISARVTSRSTSGPLPAACERTSERCSWARISVGMCRVASAPNPVEIPYDGVLAAASASTVSRARPIAETASSLSSTGAPSRATATTSSKVSGPTPTVTVAVECGGRHGPIPPPQCGPRGQPGPSDATGVSDPRPGVESLAGQLVVVVGQAERPLVVAAGEVRAAVADVGDDRVALGDEVPAAALLAVDQALAVLRPQTSLTVYPPCAAPWRPSPAGRRRAAGRC